jgi:hypothetical protein
MGDDAVLVAGLDGGLGSGIALDIARRMKCEAGTNVTLFGILLGVGEDREERANAHAALSELEYLALTDDNPFESVVLVPKPGGLSDIQAFDEAIAHTVLAHSNLSPGNRQRLDESQIVGPKRYAPFTVALPQVLRFERGMVDKALAETSDWLHARQHRLEVELDLYRELAEFVVESFPEANGPVIAHTNDSPVAPEEAPAEPMGEAFNFSVEEMDYLLGRIDTLTETLDGDLFEILDNDVAFDWLHVIEQGQEHAQANADGDASREVLAHLLHSLPDILLNDPVQRDPHGPQIGQVLHDTVRMELKAVVFRSRIVRAAHQMDDVAHREGVLRAVDKNRKIIPRDLRVRGEELGQRLQEQRERMEAVETIRNEVAERSDHRLTEFREEAHEPIETLVLIARHRYRIEEILDAIEDQIRAFVAEVENADNEDGLPEDPLDSDLLDELDGLLAELELDPIDRERLLDSAHALIEAKAAWLDWQGQFLPWVLTDWPERYEQAFVRVDLDLFDIPTADEAEQQFYCDFVGDHLFERSHEAIEARQDEATHYVIRAAEIAADTSGLKMYDFQVSAEDCSDIGWSGIDDSWRTDLRAFISSVSTSHDPSSAGQALGNLCDPGGIIREVVEEALLSPVEQALDTVQGDIEATEADLDRLERLGGLIEERGREFAMHTDDSQFPAPGTDLGSHQPSRSDQYVQSVWDEIEHLLPHKSLADVDHPDVQAIIEEFLDSTIYPFQHFDNRVGLMAGDVYGEGDAGPVPYDGHRVVRAHLGTVFDGGGDDIPTDEALADVADAVAAEGNVAGRYFGFGDPWEVATVTLIGGVFFDNLRMASTHRGYRSAYRSLRNDLGEQIRVHHAHGLDGQDQSLVESGDDAGFVFRGRVLDVHDRITMGSVIPAAEDEAVEWILDECVTAESFVGRPDSNPADDAVDPDQS